MNYQFNIKLLIPIFAVLLFFIFIPTESANAGCCCVINTGQTEKYCKQNTTCEPGYKDAATCVGFKGYQAMWYDVPAETCNKYVDQICKQETVGVLAYTSPGCATSGDCSLCDGIKVFTNIAQMILGAAGAFALLMFIIGGFLMILSQGRQELVEKGKKILSGTLIGLVIILGSWQITRIAIVIIVEKQTTGDDAIKTEQNKRVTEIMKIFTDPKYNPCEK